MIALICTLLTGILYALSLPPYNYEWLAWWFLVPLLIAVQKKRPLIIIGMGLLAALTTGIVQVGWHQNSGRLFAGYYPFFMLFPVFAIIAITASVMYEYVKGFRWVFIVAFAGITCEWLTLFMPLPVNLALSQYKQRYLIQIASVTGIWGVSFIIWWTNAVIADCVLRYLGNRSDSRDDVRMGLLPAGITVLLWGAALAYGCFTLSTDKGPVIKVAAIQDYNGDETGDLAPPRNNAIPIDREEMTRSAAAQGAQFIVWSEECLGYGFEPDPAKASPLSNSSLTSNLRKKHKHRIDPTIQLARDLKCYVVAGYLAPGSIKPYNCAALIAPDGKVLGIHRKINLYAEERRNLTPGTIAASVNSDIGKVGMEICFDTCNTAITRRIAATGARLLAVPNYDPPVVRGILHNLHAALVTYRCVENGIPMVRTDSNGNSQIIDRHGLIIRQGPLFAPAVLIANIRLGNGHGTLFTHYGDWFAYLCIAGFCIQLFLLRSHRPITGHIS